LALLEACDLEAARATAAALESRHAAEPAWVRWAGDHRSDLSRGAEAQKAARRHLRLGKVAIYDKKLDDAIAHLQRALAVPDVPECLRKTMADLLAELDERKRGSATPAPPAGPGSLKLVRIEVTRTYPRNWKADSGMVEPGQTSYGPGQRAFKLGWSFPFKSEMAEDNYQGKCHAMADVTIDAPATVRNGETARLSATMNGAWDMKGYGITRDYTIRVSGSAGEKKLSVPGKPSGAYSGSLSSTGEYTVYADRGNTTLSVRARLNFGMEHVADMDIRFEYAAAP
jgi:hypothetical protein